jgi:hypothetical protein
MKNMYPFLANSKDTNYEAAMVTLDREMSLTDVELPFFEP